MTVFSMTIVIDELQGIRNILYEEGHHAQFGNRYVEAHLQSELIATVTDASPSEIELDSTTTSHTTEKIIKETFPAVKQKTWFKTEGSRICQQSDRYKIHSICRANCVIRMSEQLSKRIKGYYPS